MKRYNFTQAVSTGRPFICINHIVTRLPKESSLHEYLDLPKFLYELSLVFSDRDIQRILREGTFWVSR